MDLPGYPRDLPGAQRIFYFFSIFYIIFTLFLHYFYIIFILFLHYQFYWKKKRTKRYPQNGANAPMVGANVPTEPQNL